MENRTWSDADKKDIMVYMGCMYGYELAARLSEYTKPERGQTDHCLRTDDLSFAGKAPTGDFNVVGVPWLTCPQRLRVKDSGTWNCAISEESPRRRKSR